MMNLQKTSGAQQYQQFLEQNSAQYLIIYSADVEHIWELNDVISITYSNIRPVLYCLPCRTRWL